MAVNLSAPSGLLPVTGIRLGTTQARIKNWDRDDVTVIAMAEGGTAAAVFTRNQFCAAPVMLARQHLALSASRYLLINAGNANAGTGTAGLAAAKRTCEALARVAGCEHTAVLPFSTGVIGEPLPADKICEVLPVVLQQLAQDNWLTAARAIMTTDTLPKACSQTVTIDGQPITVTGIAKGAGMIRPDMATMLSFIATDAPIAQPLLQQCLEHAVEHSFNRISVDGDTSTNDACVLLASGKAAISRIEDIRSPAYIALQDTVTAVCQYLAQAIVRDGEGATKFITVAVEDGRTSAECLQVAYAVAHSPLVKTAFFASDPNWGRIVAAIGRAGVADLDISRVSVYLNEVCIFHHGTRSGDYTEAQGQRVMKLPEITVRIILDRGECSEMVWTCDFSYDYVRINADYRT